LSSKLLPNLGLVVLQIGEITEGPFFAGESPRSGVQPGQVTAMSTTVCEIAQNPEQFSGTMVSLRHKIGISFEDFELSASDCIGRKIDAVWLEYGRGPHRQPTTWCCGDMVPRDPLILVENADFRRFNHYLTAQRKTRDCFEGQCYLYDVTATLTGRFDLASPGQCKESNVCCGVGFGHFGVFCGRLVIGSVSDVLAVPSKSRPPKLGKP
jgi:hypothetical protein